MKKTVVLAFAVLMTSAACASSGAATISTPLAAAEPVQNAVEAPSAGGNPFAKETNDDIIPPEGTYVSTSENFSGKYRPSVTFKEDGTFVMEENLYEGMGTYSGQYTYDGYYYECEVKEIGFSGFAGDDKKTIGFARFDGDLITLMDDLCGSAAKDIFVKEERLEEVVGKEDQPKDSNPGTEEYTIKPKQEVGAVTEKWLYTSASKMFSDPYMPTLQLNTDGTFELTENLFEGMGHYTGTYAIEDEYRLTLTVTNTDFKGFRGDDVKTIEFEALSKDVLELRTELCGSVTGDIFYLNP